MIFCFILFWTIPLSFSTPIPPNCTRDHEQRSKSTKPRTWTCPEGSPSIWREHVCDAFFHCRKTLGDEKICVDYGPVGSSNITLVDEKISIGLSAKLVVPRVFSQNFECSAPICVREEEKDDLAFKAHLICRQTGRSTYQRIGTVENDRSRWPIAFSSDSLRCKGYEETIQQCFDRNSSRKFFLDDECPRLFAVSCAKECSKEIIIGGTGVNSAEPGEVYFAPPTGTLVSPGFPDFLLPYLDCTWTIQAERRHLVVVQLKVLNLQEFRVGSAEDGGEVVCANSYVELGLGVSPSGTYVKHRLCSEDAIGKNLTSFGSRVYVRYVSGRYLGSITGEKGFALSYHTIEANWIPDDEDTSRLSPGIIVLIVLSCFGAVVCAILGMMYCFSKSKYRARRLAKHRQRDMVMRLHNRQLFPTLGAPDCDGHFNPGVVCSVCHTLINHVDDLCPHYARILPFFVDRRNNRLGVETRTRRPSQTSNVTIDMDELLREDRERRRQQRRWQSMDASCISTTNATISHCDHSFASSHTVQLDSTLSSTQGSIDKKSVAQSPAKKTPQMVVRNAASALRDFLNSKISTKSRENLESSILSVNSPNDDIQSPELGDDQKPIKRSSSITLAVNRLTKLHMKIRSA